MKNLWLTSLVRLAGLAALLAGFGASPVQVLGGADPPGPGDTATGIRAGTSQGVVRTPAGTMASQATDCTVCHSCSDPTSENPCLKTCPRDQRGEFKERLNHLKGPTGIILLDMLGHSGEGQDRLGPVPFDHGGHAAMAEMSDCCTCCHHYTPQGTQHPACRTCHETTLRREDIRKPGLKGAYHRQCMGCHREWAHETDCRMCHLPIVGQGQELDLSELTTYMAEQHPPIPEPVVEVYETDMGDTGSTRVTFRHVEHTSRYGLRCVECHQGDNCMRCHEQGRKHEQKVRTLEEHHKPCAACHDTNNEDRCTHCHVGRGAPTPPPFDHNRTGWPLSRYHTDNPCTDCHKSVPFARLDRACQSCHSGWDPENFDHAVTGQRLDQNHAGIDCADCHLDQRYDVPPSCEECHDDEEGIQFPDRRPGPQMLPGAKRHGAEVERS